MSLRDHLPLRGVTITKTTMGPDAYGDIKVLETKTTTLARAGIWSVNQGNRTISDKIAKTSTHILATQTYEYAFSDTDSVVSYNGVSYRLTGHSDDVAMHGLLTLHGMERIS